MQNSKNIQKSIEQLEGDLKVRVEKLTAQIDASPFDGVADKLRNDREALTIAYKNAIEKRKNDLEEVLKIEEAIDVRQAAVKSGIEKQKRDRALSEWVRAGGNERDFAERWDDIRNTMLQDEVVSKMTADKRRNAATSILRGF